MSDGPNSASGSTPSSGFEHSSDPNFTAYYAEASLSARSIDRFTTIRNKGLTLLAERAGRTGVFDVADIGCGAGTQSFLWAELGHRVIGLDVNAPLVDVARARADERKLSVRFDVGSATALPYADASLDVVLLTELLEHVADWESCVNEALRVLRNDGLLYLSTTNALCPKQQEFTLPLYSWYPGFVKRYCERLAVTTRPAIANHARYPAVHWFTFYQLRRYLADRGAVAFDRIDMIDATQLGAAAGFLVNAARALPPLRLLGHVATEGTVIFALKRRDGTQ